MATALIAITSALTAPALAQDDPPGRVGRLADLQGSVSWFDHEQGEWAAAERNRPLTSGDRISTAAQARAELRVGSTVLRLGPGSELEVLRLDDERMVFQLHGGSLAARVRSREVAAELELDTGEVRLQPVRAGHYRLDRIDDTTHAAAWRGALRIDDPQGFIVETGQRVELWREGTRGAAGRAQPDERAALRFAWGQLPADDFGAWALAEDEREQKTASTRYVSPEMTGAEDLDRYGRWEQHPEYGALWFPLGVDAEWAPYRYGRWAWVRPWGWTWVDDTPWGFAPFHYGRWMHWHGRWGWAPGVYVGRPVYAPALVAWVGGGGWGISVQIGGPSVGWVPLAPREVFAPWYRHGPVHLDRVNGRRPPEHGRPYEPLRLPDGPRVYGNQGVLGGVTVVPRDALLNRRPVAPTVERGADRGQRPQEPLSQVPPPVRDVHRPGVPFRRDGGPGERQPERPSDRPGGRPNERADERANERANDRPNDRGSDHADDRPTVPPPAGRADPRPGWPGPRPETRRPEPNRPDTPRERLPAPAAAPPAAPPQTRPGPTAPSARPDSPEPPRDRGRERPGDHEPGRRPSVPGLPQAAPLPPTTPSPTATPPAPVPAAAAPAPQTPAVPRASVPPPAAQPQAAPPARAPTPEPQRRQERPEEGRKSHPEGRPEARERENQR